MMKHCFPVLLALAASGVCEAQITIDTPPSILCSPGPMSLPYTAVGTFNPGNVFTAELSDASGSFAAPAVIGSTAALGSGSISCTLPPGLVGNGFRLRVNSSDPALIGDISPTNLLAEATPNAGSSASATICGSALSAMPFLGGTPDPGGTWTYVMGSGVWVTDDQFAGVMSGDVVQYTVTSPGGCSASAQLVVNSVQPPNAGTSATSTVCESAAPISMLTLLGGTPNAGGFWTSPAGSPAPNLFTPGVSLPGCYTYVDAGVAPCPNAVASLCISVTSQADAGEDAAISVCEASPPVDLFSALGGTPQPGGDWYDPDWNPMGGVFGSGVSAPGCYSYVVAGTGLCLGDTAEVCVSIDDLANAGADATVSWCQSAGPLDLFAQLSGTPDSGGVWTDPSATGGLTVGLFDPAGVPAGTYFFVYAVDSGTCGTATAVVTVNLGACLTSPALDNE